MKHKDADYHPVIYFLYFALVLVFSMFFMHPLFLIASLSSSIAYSIYLRGRKAVHFSLLYMLPLMLLTALVNPVLNHEGATIVAYLPSGNPLTLESILYGIAAAAMLVSVITWFSCCSAVITTDQFVYLFGRLIPALSLVLSMTLRFVPKFRTQINVVVDTQRDIGHDISAGSPFQRLRNAIAIVSIMVTWSLENAIETADSMKSRGYGLRGRTAFSIYRFVRRDLAALLWLLGSGLYLIVGWISGAADWRYFPTMNAATADAYSVSLAAVYFALCLTPVIANTWEDRKWIRLQSKI